jgi:hypothetical protein
MVVCSRNLRRGGRSWPMAYAGEQKGSPRPHESTASPGTGSILISSPSYPRYLQRSGRSRRCRGPRGSSVTSEGSWPFRRSGHHVGASDGGIEPVAQLQGSCTSGGNTGFRAGPHINITQFENTDASREYLRDEHRPASGRHQAAIRRTVNRILLIAWTLGRAGDGNRTRTISLGICAVRACHMA